MGRSIQEAMASPRVWQPATAAEAWHCKHTYGSDSIYIAGGTLLRTWWEAGTAVMPPHLIDISGIPGLNEITVGEAGVEIGSQTALQACRNHPLLQRDYPIVAEAIRAIAAPSIRHLGTIGGNVASMTGDSITALLACGASLVWYNGMTEVTEELGEWLLAAPQPGYSSDRLLLRIELPVNQLVGAPNETGKERNATKKTRRISAFHKVGRREAFTPSVVTVAVNGTLSDNGEFDELRIAAGGGQTIPGRLDEIEQACIGTKIGPALLSRLHDRILQLFEPREDVFASAAYRKQTAANLIVTELWKASGGPSGQGG